jgi:hypothetical protein
MMIEENTEIFRNLTSSPLKKMSPEIGERTAKTNNPAGFQT